MNHRGHRVKVGTRQEAEALRVAAEVVREQGYPFAKDLESLYDKLTGPSPPGLEIPMVRAFEKALIEASGGKVIEIKGKTDPGHFIVLGRILGKCGATVEEARKVGEWLASRPWDARLTITDIARGWVSYRARAMAEPEVAVAQKRRDFTGEA